MHDDSNSSMRAGTPVYLSIKLKRLYREGLDCSLVKDLLNVLERTVPDYLASPMQLLKLTVN
jgi:RNA:NAD 2'-phosphotransferase (TPT1/KptA family)